jgi:hypothetical protein
MVEYEEKQGDQEPIRGALSSGSKGGLLSSSRNRVERQGPTSRSRNDQEVSEAISANVRI